MAGNGIGCAAFICVMGINTDFLKNKSKIRDNIYCCWAEIYDVYLRKPMGNASVAYGTKDLPILLYIL